MQEDKNGQFDGCRRLEYLFVNAVISSTDGLSFNYLDKSVEEEVFSVRREYRCRQDLGALREQLKLDF